MIATLPHQSIPRRTVGSLVSGTKRAMPRSTMRPMGMLMKKAHRHERSVVSHPPSSGPTAAIPPMVDPQMAKAMARSWPT